MPASRIHVDSRSLGHECGYMTSDFVGKVECCSEFVETYEGLEDTQSDVIRKSGA